MATADDAINMLTELLMKDGGPHQGITLEYLSPAASLRKQAEEIERREEIVRRAWEMVRDHRVNR